MKDRSKIWAVVLAAGESKRMQAPKLVLPFNGTTIIGSVLGAIRGAGIDNVMLVTGCWKEEVLNEAVEYKVRSCHNYNYRDGMLSSVQCGLKNLPSDCHLAMICLGDQPLISSRTIEILSETALVEGEGIYLPLNEGRRGHPIIIGRNFFADVFGLDNKTGLKELLLKHPGKVREVQISETHVHIDIDTINDYNKILNKT